MLSIDATGLLTSACRLEKVEMQYSSLQENSKQQNKLFRARFLFSRVWFETITSAAVSVKKDFSVKVGLLWSLFVEEKHYTL